MVKKIRIILWAVYHTCVESHDGSLQIFPACPGGPPQEAKWWSWQWKSSWLTDVVILVAIALSVWVRPQS